MKEFLVVITVFNERENIAPLVQAVRNALAGINYEVVFVDDGSKDGTQREIRSQAEMGKLHDSVNDFLVKDSVSYQRISKHLKKKWRTY